MYFQWILFLTLVRQSDAFPLYLKRSNAFYFLCPSDLSGASYFPLSCCWCFWHHFWAVSLCNTPFPNASHLQHLLLIFPDKIGFLCLPFMKWLLWREGMGTFISLCCQACCCLCEPLETGEEESPLSSLEWLTALHTLSVYPWSVLLRSSKH